jgi:hypothetical protein
MRKLKSALNREHAEIGSFARAALLTIFLIAGALSSIYLDHHFDSVAYLEVSFFGGFVVIVASLSFLSGLTEIMFRRSDNSINSERGSAPGVTIVPLDYHSRCSEPGCRKLGRILLRYADGRSMSNREFCNNHCQAKVKRDRAAGIRVYDNRLRDSMDGPRE